MFLLRAYILINLAFVSNAMWDYLGGIDYARQAEASSEVPGVIRLVRPPALIIYEYTYREENWLGSWLYSCWVSSRSFMPHPFSSLFFWIEPMDLSCRSFWILLVDRSNRFFYYSFDSSILFSIDWLIDWMIDELCVSWLQVPFVCVRQRRSNAHEPAERGRLLPFRVLHQQRLPPDERRPGQGGPSQSPVIPSYHNICLGGWGSGQWHPAIRVGVCRHFQFTKLRGLE